MGPSDRRCHVCRESVPGSDLEQGRAVTLLKKLYCPRSSEQIATKGLRPTQRILRQLRSRSLAVPAAAILTLAAVALLFAVYLFSSHFSQ